MDFEVAFCIVCSRSSKGFYCSQRCQLLDRSRLSDVGPFFTLHEFSPPPSPNTPLFNSRNPRFSLSGPTNEFPSFMRQSHVQDTSYLKEPDYSNEHGLASPPAVDGSSWGAFDRDTFGHPWYGNGKVSSFVCHIWWVLLWCFSVTPTITQIWYQYLHLPSQHGLSFVSDFLAIYRILPCLFAYVMIRFI